MFVSNFLITSITTVLPLSSYSIAVRQRFCRKEEFWWGNSSVLRLWRMKILLTCELSRDEELIKSENLSIRQLFKVWVDNDAGVTFLGGMLDDFSIVEPHIKVWIWNLFFLSQIHFLIQDFSAEDVWWLSPEERSWTHSTCLNMEAKKWCPFKKNKELCICILQDQLLTWAGDVQGANGCLVKLFIF